MLTNNYIYNKHELDSYHHEINENYTNLLILFKEQKTTEDKLNHLIQFTIINRLQILDLNCSSLFNSSIRKDNISYARDCTEISMHLNSFYFHLSGIIDNLAWYLEYSLNLLNIKIGGSKNKNKIGLQKKRNQDFLEELKIKNIDLYNLIIEYQEWFIELNEKRDPVAHRKPIYIPPTVMLNDIKQFKPVAYLDDKFIFIIDSLVNDNEKLYQLCKGIVRIIKNENIK
ncbi:MAG: hypothetical protein COA66_13885 [Arcobacter sp.]|nr:MAG: hypothetical protein COA66_13885 [Arcobacter sp.]